jgi:hypothetical protein
MTTFTLAITEVSLIHFEFCRKVLLRYLAECVSPFYFENIKHDYNHIYFLK